MSAVRITVGSHHQESWEHTNLLLVVVDNDGVDLLRAAREWEDPDILMESWLEIRKLRCLVRPHERWESEGGKKGVM